MSSVSLVRDALWERALASQPEPLVRAVRVAGLDDPAVLLNNPRSEDITGLGLEVPSGAASPTHCSTPAFDSSLLTPLSTATSSGSAASAAGAWDTAMGI